MLTRNQELPVPGHLGTTDVDIHVTIHADASQDLSIVEDALERAGFAPDPERAWRWLTTISGTRVQMEFVCDRDDLPAGAEITLPRCSTLRAANLRGTGFVARDNSPEEITGTIDGATVSRVARFAGAQGYVLAKACALRDRQAAKDCYDFAYVLLYNRAGGPRELGAALRAGTFAEDIAGLRTVLVTVAAMFEDANGYAALSYAAEAMKVTPDADHAQLRADAVAAVAEFIDELGV